MKKRTFYYAILFGFSVCTALISCKNNPKMANDVAKADDAPISFAIEIMASDILHELSDHSSDSLYLKAFAIAAEKQKTDTASHFIDLFNEAYAEQSTDSRLAFVFGTYGMRERVRPESSNSDVILALYDEYEKTFSNTKNIICSRLERYGATNIACRRVGRSNRIVLTADNVTSPQRVKRLVTQVGKLGFWETYDNISRGDDPGIFELLYSANEVIREQGKEELPDSNLMELDYPLFYALRPSVDQSSGRPYQTPCLGVAAIADTAKINAMLSLPKVRTLFPNNLRFLWSNKSVGRVNEDDERLDLIAIKVSTENGEAPLGGDVIVKAKAEENEWGWYVSVEMNEDGARRWARLTYDNIGSAIAMVIDNKVFSYPIVNSEIIGGKSWISGNFAKEEAEDMALMLGSGELPVSAKIVETIAIE